MNNRIRRALSKLEQCVSEANIFLKLLARIFIPIVLTILSITEVVRNIMKK